MALEFGQILAQRLDEAGEVSGIKGLSFGAPSRTVTAAIIPSSTPSSPASW